MFILFSSNTTGNAGNCFYQNPTVVTDKKLFAQAVSRDYVCAEYKDHKRSNTGFLRSNCLALDCDNDFSDKPADWVTPEKIMKAFPEVEFGIHYSRNNMKEKNGRAPRPKFHVLFPIKTITSAEEYAALKRATLRHFPFFDKNALDAARFFFGTREPEVELYGGSTTVDAFLAEHSYNKTSDAVIPQGSRNSEMSKTAAKLLKRYGDTTEALVKFRKEAKRCQPPLPERELEAIWKSAIKFYSRVSLEADYIPPEKYGSTLRLKPSDYSDVGQAKVLADEYSETLRYSEATDFIVYNGSYWEESAPKAQAKSQELTDRQLAEAEEELALREKEMLRGKVFELLTGASSRKSATNLMTDSQKRILDKYNAALAYRDYIIKRRDSRKISATLTEAQPMLYTDPSKLDRDAFKLNAPSATYDLKTGEKLPHDPEDMITRQTAFDPSEEGRELWEKALDTIFCGDRELIDYVRKIVGLAAIGKVYLESMIISFGNGHNGKSTFWNTISAVLGSYSGGLSAEVLTSGCRRNIKPEIAELRGKRLVTAAELEEGTRLSTSALKQLNSTDDLIGEKKYKAPFSFTPTHTLVLYTNHLPKVGTLDSGTWRRLIVVPFNAKITGEPDIKNYSDYLVKNAGGAVMQWIIDGARAVIGDSFKPVLPQAVASAISCYREENNWLGIFLEECCEIRADYEQPSGLLYETYRDYCFRSGEYTRSVTDFYSALLADNRFTKRRSNKGRQIIGLRLRVGRDTQLHNFS